MDGQPLRYRLNADGSFVLYSVGEDARGDARPRAVSRSQIHRAGVLAGTAAVVSHPSSPARAVAGGGTIRVLKRLVFYLPV